MKGTSPSRPPDPPPTTTLFFQWIVWPSFFFKAEKQQLKKSFDENVKENKENHQNKVDREKEELLICAETLKQATNDCIKTTLRNQPFTPTINFADALGCKEGFF
ncbi:hypothetical protein PGT21_009566 [Puccinia graminis f. sp. tritici]|uniref:Uncharacterized protein n=1 Tax=Puccinia graminis f. sp. tritici TaxID=56615 RepID=A0A5B0QNJ5_PUCGR|nr:hypothetical protein PGT21_009566 [Puccinia graminis f. sp. tritici]